MAVNVTTRLPRLIVIKVVIAAVAATAVALVVVGLVIITAVVVAAASTINSDVELYKLDAIVF